MWEPLSANLAVLLALLVGWTSASEWVARFSPTTQKTMFVMLMVVAPSDGVVAARLVRELVGILHQLAERRIAHGP